MVIKLIYAKTNGVTLGRKYRVRLGDYSITITRPPVSKAHAEDVAYYPRRTRAGGALWLNSNGERLALASLIVAAGHSAPASWVGY